MNQKSSGLLDSTMTIKYRWQFLYVYIFIYISQCSGHSTHFRSDPTYSGKMCAFYEVQFQSIEITDIACVRSCWGHPGCYGIIYQQSNNSCVGINTDSPFTVSYELPGAVYYGLTPATNDLTTTTTTTGPTSTTEQPTAGPTTSTVQPTVPTTTPLGCSTSALMVPGVSDSQITASSVYPIGSYDAFNARLDNIDAWAAEVSDLTQYIMVDFLTPRVITAVVTQGNGKDNEWIATYRVGVSSNCFTWDPIRDLSGVPMVFPGNSDASTKVTNTITPPVLARCLRILPLTWSVHIGSRFDVEGCIPI